MNKHTDADMQRRAMQRAAGRPYFLASALATYRELHGIDDAALAAALGCTPDALPHLGLCRRPDPAASDFRTAVQQIADYAGITPFPLAALLRDVQVAEAMLDGAPPGASSEGHDMLLAARDRPPQPPTDDVREPKPDAEPP